jgi:hypothetical protein
VQSIQGFNAALAIDLCWTDLSAVKTKYAARPKQPAKRQPELAPAGTPPHVAVAPGLLDQAHTVVREPGESAERYRSRCELLAAVLDFAKKG